MQAKTSVLQVSFQFNKVIYFIGQSEGRLKVFTVGGIPIEGEAVIRLFMNLSRAYGLGVHVNPLCYDEDTIQIVANKILLEMKKVVYN